MSDKPKLPPTSDYLAGIHQACRAGRHDLAEKLVRNRDLAVVERMRDHLIQYHGEDGIVMISSSGLRYVVDCLNDSPIDIDQVLGAEPRPAE